MINKLVRTAAEALEGIKDGATVLVDGFGAVGQAPVGGEGGQGVGAGLIERVLGREVALFGEPGADGGRGGAARWPWVRR